MRQGHVVQPTPTPPATKPHTCRGFCLIAALSSRFSFALTRPKARQDLDFAKSTLAEEAVLEGVDALDGGHAAFLRVRRRHDNPVRTLACNEAR